MSTSNVRDALESAKLVFVEGPAAACKSINSATASLISGLRCEISGPDGEHATTDMHKPMGGKGSSPNSGWLLRASRHHAPRPRLQCARPNWALELTS